MYFPKFKVLVLLVIVAVGLVCLFRVNLGVNLTSIVTRTTLTQIGPAKLAQMHPLYHVKTGTHPRPQLFKPFLYLIQTEKCLRPHMRPFSALGNSSVCDVLVLSYKERCNDTSLSHVSYIFNTSTTLTWTTGRTELYYAAKQLDKRYLYYIFMDDDVIMEWMHDEREDSAWRAFEQFLLEKEPPLAATDNTYWKIVDKNFAKRRAEQCTMNGTHPEYFLAVWFDAIVNAFHYKAVEHILEAVLPLWHRYDHVSWWFSQWYINFITDVIFHEQAMLPSDIMGTNPIHRMYPKFLHNASILAEIAKDVQGVIPLEYKEAAAVVLKRWVPSYEKILTTVSETYCHPIPAPCQEIVPFKGLQSVSMH